jgi:peptide/nickel transport system ATP-binding protein
VSDRVAVRATMAPVNGRRGRDPLLAVDDLVVEFGSPHRGIVRAVSGVSLEVDAGETIGVVGESGSGKTTLGRAIMQLERVTSGSVRLDGNELTALKGRELRSARGMMQMIFQDAVSSLNPRRSVRELVREGRIIQYGDDDPRREEVIESVIESVDLEELLDRRPHELSGGQCQRVSLARAIAIEPELVILDEPVSALDVSVQAQVLTLLERLRTEFGLTMVFISHDLAVVRNVSDRVMVMYLGRVCETADVEDLFDAPRHPYTAALLASVPGNPLDLPPAGDLISGEPPSPIDPPSGCRFRTRCPHATERCATEQPALVEIASRHALACHHPLEI